MLAAEHIRQRRDLHPERSLGAVGIELRGLRGVQQIDAGLTQSPGIGFERAGIALEVLAGSELGGIDEQADHHVLGTRHRVLDQAHVPRVEVAHGRDQRDPAAARAPARDLIAYLVVGMDHPHRRLRNSARAPGMRLPAPRTHRRPRPRARSRRRP